MSTEPAAQLQDLEAWKREEGYWYGKLTFLNEEGRYNYAATNNPLSGQFDYRDYYGFINLQVKDGELKQRNIFVRPPLDIEPFDIDGDSTVSADELNLFGFSSPFGYEIDTKTKTATPEDEEINAYQYNEGTEQTFTADQTATDGSGTLNGSYFGIPTVTQTLGDNTIVYTVGDNVFGLFQNQLTTLPGRESRVRTAQGFGGGQPSYASFYRETKIGPTVDEKGYVTKSAQQNFLDLLAEHRTDANVPESLITENTEEFFTTGLEQADPRGIGIASLELSLDAAIGHDAEANAKVKGTNGGDDLFILSGQNIQAKGRGGANTFVISPSGEEITADLIKDFDAANGDRLVLNPDSIQTPAHDPLTYAVAADKAEYKALKKDAPALIYREDKGHLILDANGSDAGLGDGGRLVKLKGAPELVGSDLYSLIELVAEPAI